MYDYNEHQLGLVLYCIVLYCIVLYEWDPFIWGTTIIVCMVGSYSMISMDNSKVIKVDMPLDCRSPYTN